MRFLDIIMTNENQIRAEHAMRNLSEKAWDWWSGCDDRAYAIVDDDGDILIYFRDELLAGAKHAYLLNEINDIFTSYYEELEAECEEV